MKLEKEKKKTYQEYLDRSSKGQWFRGILKDDCIEIYWKPLFKKVGNEVIEYSFDGYIEKRHNPINVDWGDEWRFGGKLSFNDNMVEICGIDNFDKFSFGIMRHIVCLLACEFGENIEEIIESFEDIGSLNFIISDKYSIVSSHGEISDFIGNVIDIETNDDIDEDGDGDIDNLIARISVNGNDYEIDVRNPSILTSFIICTKPI